MTAISSLAAFVLAAVAAGVRGEDPKEEVVAAITAGDRSGVERLLAAHSALVTARTAAGASLVSLCVYVGKPDLAEVFLRFGAKLDVFEAAALGSLSVLEEFARDKAMVNSFSPDGYTPLALAAFFGHSDAVRLLLASGADVHAVARNAQRVTALHAALAGPAPETAELLLKAGADPNVRQEGDHTPLHQAAARGLEPIVELLLACGASTGARNSDGKTPYDLAKQKGHDALAERFLR